MFTTTISHPPTSFILKNVPVASSLPELAKGLSGKKSGRLLLRFSKPGLHSIWMPFMHFSLDLAFLSGAGKIITVLRGIPPISHLPSTWKTYSPENPCSFILEVESGLLKKLKKGDKLIVNLHTT